MATEESSEYDADKGGGDSDEDCEVYFLKPVNEYNIVDKIKEANKELFSSDAETTPQGTDPNDPNGNGSGEAPSQRKVTFAPNLENYEPEGGGGGGAGETNNNYTGVDEADEAVMPRTGADMKLRSPETSKFPAIDEDEDAEIKANEAEIAVLKAEDRELMMEIEAAKEVAKRSSKKKREPDGEPEPEEEKPAETEPDNVDEICEEIIVMDMEEGRAAEGSAPHRRIIKQDTFDYDNKSLSNLLTSDYEEDIEEDDGEGDVGEEKDSEVAEGDIEAEGEANDEGKSLSATESSSSNNNNNSSTESAKDLEGSTERPDGLAEPPEDGEEEEDDTDNLSIIVSSYIPDDFPRLLSAGSTKRSKCGQHAATAATPASTIKSRLSFTKRFSFRRKTKASQQAGGSAATAKGSSGCCTKSPHLGGRGGGGHPHHHRDDEPPVTDLKLHYKTCCEYRQSTLERLPRYTGYLSEYGLSREQLLEREQRQQQKQRFVLEQTLKTSEQEMLKMQDNERAFTTWLKNKMRYPINRTRNMFDVRKKSRSVVPPPPQPPKVCSSPYRRHCSGGCGGEAATSPSRLITPFTIAGGIFDLAPYNPPKRGED